MLELTLQGSVASAGKRKKGASSPVAVRESRGKTVGFVICCGEATLTVVSRKCFGTLAVAIA